MPPLNTPQPPMNDDEDNFIDDAALSSSPSPIGAAPPPAVDPEMGDRLERLGGEPAPVITPEEFARLQKAGQVNIDARGRVRTARRTGAEGGVSLRKRRAWYDRR
ncbi:MAG: hypothetical protein H7Y11_05895 [Armatimonadetes bacterium]|nr:hypothetical protein [Anaerolineae bacterium]